MGLVSSRQKKMSAVQTTDTSKADIYTKRGILPSCLLRQNQVFFSKGDLGIFPAVSAANKTGYFP